MTKYLAVYEYDDGEDWGGAAPIYYGPDVTEACRAAVADMADSIAWYATDRARSWRRLDVWRIDDDSISEDDAWDMWRDAELPDMGDVLHAYICGGHS